MKEKIWMLLRKVWKKEKMASEITRRKVIVWNEEKIKRQIIIGNIRITPIEININDKTTVVCIL